MSSRAHHPAERDSAESSVDGVRGPGSGESGVTGVDEAVSREVLLPALVEPARGDAAVVPHEAAASEGSAGQNAAGSAGRDEDDDDAEDVVPEPDSVPPLVAELDEANAAVSEAAKVAPSVAIAAIVDVGAPAGDGVEPPVVAERRSSRPPPLPPKDEASSPGERRSSRPPPLRDLTVHELAPSSAEMTADELERAAGVEPAREPFVGAAAERTAFAPPWVDEVPDPVTPYEQRVSETVKVADLPPVEQLRGRVLANR